MSCVFSVERGKASLTMAVCCRYFVQNPTARGGRGRHSSRRSTRVGSSALGPAGVGHEAGLKAHLGQAMSSTTLYAQPVVPKCTAAEGCESLDALVHVNIAAPSVAEASAAAAEDTPRELELLKNINAFATPGDLMALMGGSGALQG